MRARCSCGAHALALPCPPPRVTLCFCADCRRRTGAPFGVGAYYAAADLDLPPLPTRRRVAASGRWLDDHACERCGTVLFWTFELDPGQVGVPVGLLDAGFDVAPDRAVFCRDKPAWFALPAGVEAFVLGSDGPRFGGVG